jgi:hypothetical protein
MKLIVDFSFSRIKAIRQGEDKCDMSSELFFFIYTLQQFIVALSLGG